MSTQVDLFTNVEPTSVSPAIAKLPVSRSTFYQGDCLVEMDKIADKSVDMILCDLPYGTTACSWDAIIPFSELWGQYKRIIKSSGNIVLTASQPFTSALVMSNPEWFSYGWIWEKEQGVNFLSANKMPLKVHEDILVFRKPDNYGITEFVELRELFKMLLEKIGLNKRQIINELGQGLDHCFRFNSSQWGLPTRKNYEILLSTYSIHGMPDYDTLLNKYNAEFYRVYNPQLTVGKPYLSGLGNSGEVTGNVNKVQTKNEGTRQPTTILRHKRETGLHPTQKPIELMEYLIKTYTNECDTVLDNCMGSGTTGVACKKTGRHFIGIEKDPKYFEIAVSRVSAYCG